MPTISSLPAASSVTGADLVVVDQTNTDGSMTLRKATVTQLGGAIGGGSGGGSSGSFTLTSAVLQAALITLIQSLPTAPTAGTPTLWSNSGTPEYS
jgi:hypothetical protein